MRSAKLSVFFIAAFLIAGCVDKKDPRTKHDQPIRERNAQGSENALPSEKEGTADFFGLDLNALYKISLTKPKNRFNATIEPLAALFLEQSRLSSIPFQTHKRTMWALRFLNSEIMLASQEGQNLDKFLATYAERIYAGCDLTTMQGCRNLPFFRRDSQVSAVMKLVAKQAKDLKSYYNAIKIAQELLGAQGDAELASMAYSRMVDLFKTFLDVAREGEYTRLTVKKGLSSEQKAQFNMWVTFLSGIMSTNPNLKADSSHNAEFFDWLSSRQMESLFGVTFTSQITRLLGARLNEPAVWNRFVVVFNRDQRDSDTSYVNNLKRVKEYDPLLLERLGVKPYDLRLDVRTGSKNLATMLFLNRILELRPMSRELYLYEFGQTSPEQTVDMIESIVRVSLVERAMFTSREMAKFYRQLIANGRADRDLIEETLKFSERKLTPMWADYVNRMEQLQFFFNEHIKRRHADETDTALAEKIERVNNLFVELNPTIQYMVTYPNMLMLGYYAVKSNLQMSIKTFFGATINIDKHLILHELMNGKMPPMLLFTKFKEAEEPRNRAAIDPVQMMWALNFAVAFDLPKLYDIKAADFLSKFFATYNQPTNQAMREASEMQRAALLPQGDADKVFDLCAADPSKPFIDTQTNIELLGHVTFLGQAALSGSIKPLLPAVKLLTFADGLRESSLVETIETLRTDVDPKLRQMFLIRSVFANAPNPEKDAIAVLDNQMRETLTLRNVVLETTRRLTNDLPACVIKLQEYEVQRRREILDMEAEFLRQTALAYKIAVETIDANQAMEKLKAMPEFSSLNTSLSLGPALNEMFARKVGLDRAFNEIKGYQEDYFKHAAFQRTVSGRLIYKYRVQDLYTRLAMYMDHGFEGQTFKVKLDSIHVSLPNSIKLLIASSKTTGDREFSILTTDFDRFRASAMVGFRRAIREWFYEQHGITTFYRSVLMARSALFKYEFLGELDLEKTVECGAQCQAERDAKMRTALRNIFEFNRSALISFNIKPDDTKVLSLFDSFSFFNIENDDEVAKEGPMGLFIRPDAIGTYIGFADDIFSYLSSIMLGAKPVFLGLRPWADQETWAAKPKNSDMAGAIQPKEMMMRYDYFWSASKYYRSIRDKKRLLQFKIDDSIDQQIVLYHTQKLKADFEIVEMFLDELYSWGKQREIPPAFFSLRRGPIPLQLISPALISTYRLRMDIFHDTTDHIFELKKN